MRTSLNLLLLLTASALLGGACSTPTSPPPGPTPPAAVVATFDRSVLLQDLVQRVIVPAYANADTQARDLQKALERFSKGANQANLTAARAAWNRTMDAWMACEMLRFGPAYREHLDQRIAYHPVDVGLIEREIAGGGPVDAAHIAGTGVTRKGLHAMEHLLYGQGPDDPAVLRAYIMGAHAGRRRTYLSSCAQDVAQRIHAVHEAWASGGEAEAFIRATQSQVDGSLDLAVNAWVEHVEKVRKDKVQAPAGIGTGGEAKPELAENGPGQRSDRNLRIGVEQWQRFFTSDGGVGIDDHLDALRAGNPPPAALTQEVTRAMEQVMTDVDQLQGPLPVAIRSRPEAVVALDSSLKRLTVLLKNDVCSNLGIVVTFSDNDGD